MIEDDELAGTATESLLQVAPDEGLFAFDPDGT